MELFSDPSLNPCGADPHSGCTEIFVRWRSDNNAPNVDEVHRDLLTDFDSPVGAIGFFVKDPSLAMGVLKAAHGFRVHAGRPGHAFPHRGKTFAHVDDVVGGADVNTFELDPTQLECTTADTRCADTPETHQTMFDAKPNLEILDPIDAASQAQLMVRTRTAMHIPFSLVKLVLGKDLSARQAFEVL